MANTLQTPARNRQILAKLADQFQQRAAKYIDDAFHTYAKQLKDLEAQVTPPELKPIAAASITTALIGMSAENRKRALESADAEVYAAVAHSHPIVSGMTRVEHDAFKERYLAVPYPQETRRIARAKKAAVHMSEQVSDAIIPYYRSQVDHRAIAADVKAAEAAAEAAKVDG